ncbi:hypothetical protein AAA799B03_01276 [Marine Group I thaumarchaeote SCGC AAA799-B03]|uniref:Roadblock/LAMTOR2 domain-containing protein n=3 Tax=Marine Group I TaxID=905826 RepID=A0A087S648_9ARCH|nr:hypothetical protein AAA799N04_01479 [Marine Group I thaumarchaeote SCGC AAA799-N04]KFM17933.1 hypothetical protein SCCGRSA3_01472 [Marine Group I thaumarchaeote SCGC RSA3]KFM21202.1 hypothetical protein AAA799B03_01276 [Marine Group I thaumarchaeote SCGC AAA799-B03]
MNFENLLKRIMDSDVNIRHSIVTDNDGNILATSHRESVTNYLSQEETEASLKRAAQAWKGRKQLKPKIGNGLYAVAAFEKITRMTFPLGDDNLIFVSMGSDTVRTDLHEGGQKQIVEHVLNILSRDPTKE